MSASSGFPTAGGELGALIREKDWSATPLGDPEGWPQSLRTAVDLCLASRFPLFLWWGPQLVNIYNDAYAAVLGDKHPRALGEPAWEVWSEIWDVIGPLADGVMGRGEPTWSEDQLLYLERSGFAEECYFDFAYSPVTDESGGVGGLFAVVSETTGRVLGTRRLQTLGQIGSRTHGATGTARVLEQCVAALDADRRDLPFALLYEVDGEARRLVAATGLADAEARRLGAAGAWNPLRAADGARDPADRRRAFLLRDLPSLTLRPDPDRPGCDEAFVVPVGEAGDGRPDLWLVCGISRHRALDHALRQFCRLAARAIGSAVTDARAFDDERERSERLAELDRAKSAFFANVSHELRTPLTLMLGPLEDALSGRDPDPDLEMVQRNALRLLRHVGSLLELSRLQGDRVRADRRPVDLAEAAGELASVFRSAIERVGLAFEVDCRALPAPVLVDPGQLEQIMLNLLSNALKFTFSGSIGVTVRAEGPDAILEVRDTGVGVPADDLPRLFERFHRVAGTRARTAEGSGIGLALVKELVELQDGTIAVHSVPGAGTRFTVTFPLAMGTGPVPPPGPSREAEAFAAEALRWGGAGDAPPSTAADGAGADPASGGPPGGPAAAERPRVLVVDDNADMRGYLARLLAGDYEVAAAADGRQALERLRQTGADLVLSDVMMPVLDGAGLLAEIRRDPVLAGTPVVLLSARAGEEASVDGLQAGADDYVVKPFTAPELLARVAANLQLGAMRNAEARRATEHASRLEGLLDREHRIAETLQRSLLPPALAGDPFTHVAGHYEPAHASVQVGGDFYDAIAVGDGRLLLVVGDVAGHGLSAAATMGQLRASVRSAALWDPEPGSLLEHLNEVVQRQEDRPLVTCQCVLLDADGSGATYAAAGHPPALALLPDGGVQLLADGSDPALGIVRGRPFHQARLALAPQTTLLLYTDGLVERRDESLDAGIARLASRAAALRGLDPPELATRLVEAERSERPFADDVALLVATLTAPAEHLHLDLPATADSLAGLRRVVLRWLAAHDIADADAYDLLLAAHEAAANAIEHAYNLLPGRCVADLRVTADVVEIRVRDTGAWRPPREENRGRGLTLMRGVMDEVELEHDGTGTAVRMSRRCRRRTSA